MIEIDAYGARETLAEIDGVSVRIGLEHDSGLRGDADLAVHVAEQPSSFVRLNAPMMAALVPARLKNAEDI